MNGVSASALFDKVYGFTYDDIIILPGFVENTVSDICLQSRVTKKYRIKYSYR